MPGSERRAGGPRLASASSLLSTTVSRAGENGRRSMTSSSPCGAPLIGLRTGLSLLRPPPPQCGLAVVVLVQALVRALVLVTVVLVPALVLVLGVDGDGGIATTKFGVWQRFLSNPGPAPHPPVCWLHRLPLYHEIHQKCTFPD